MGDFNVVRRPYERNGSRFKPIRAGDFNSFLSDAELIDVKQGGRKFTWVSSNGLKISKLDRFLINQAFDEDWGDCTAVVGDRIFSDHCPVLLKANTVDFGPPPFRSYDHWLSLQGFKDQVKVLCDQFHPRGSADYILKAKLQNLKRGITTWRKILLPTITSKAEANKGEFLELEKQAESRSLESHEWDTWKDLKYKLLKEQRNITKDLKQKARVK